MCQVTWWSFACLTTSTWTALSSSPWPAVPTGSPATSCRYFPARQTEACRSASTPHPSDFASSSSARYFRKGCYFGLACFANMPVESELERGARMKSVGILCPSYTLLYRYMHFLENQVRSDASLVWLSILAPVVLPVRCPVHRCLVPTSCSFSCCFFLPSIKHESRRPSYSFSRLERTRSGSGRGRRRRLRPLLKPCCSVPLLSCKTSYPEYQGCHSRLGLQK